MKQPTRFFDELHPDYVCCLKKALYGLKQSPHEWFATLSEYLQTLGFRFNLSDTFVLIYTNNDIYFDLLVYVDEILLTENFPNAIKTLL